MNSNYSSFFFFLILVYFSSMCGYYTSLKSPKLTFLSNILVQLLQNVALTLNYRKLNYVYS